MLTVILTGGMSRRMGKDKAMLPFNGTPMALSLAARYVAMGPVAFSVDRPGRFPVGTYSELTDEYPGLGPLNGIVSAFSQTDANVILLTATDMPCVNPESARRLLAALGFHDACLYRDQPLFGVYARNCLESARQCLSAGRLSFRDLFNHIDVLYRTPDKMEQFLNLNTPEEYEKFIKMQNTFS
jgi:Molybdopterin-guanine dinucleotide biosynthesis protein A